jgi:hypothetical protein
MPDEEATGATDQALDALWQRVVDAWDDDKAHKALLEYALRAQALPEIAARYRAVSGHPHRGERARERLEAIVTAATQLMLSTKTPKPGKTPLPITLSAIGVTALLLAWLAYALWGSR